MTPNCSRHKGTKKAGRGSRLTQGAGAALVAVSVLCSCLLAGQGETARVMDVDKAAARAVRDELRREGFAGEDVQLESLADPVWEPPLERFAVWKARPESTESTCVGVVKDQSGAVLPETRIEIHRPGQTKIHHSGPDGAFQIDRIPPGAVEVHFVVVGFKRQVFSLVLEKGQVVRLLPVMEAGSSSEEVNAPFPRQRRDLPQIIALMGATVQNRDFRPYLVFFRDGEAIPAQLYPDTGARRLPLGRAEWLAVQGELHGFYSDLLDLDRGPDRLLPHLSQEFADFWKRILRASAPEEGAGRLPDDQSILEWICPWLDATALEAWRRLADIPPDQGDGEEGIKESDLEAIAQLLTERRAAALKRFAARGLLDPDSVREAEPYLRRLLGEGLLIKEDLSGISGLGLGEVYTIKLLPYLRVYLDWRGDHLRIVGMMIDD